MTEDAAPYVTGREASRPDGWYWYREAVYMPWEVVRVCRKDGDTWVYRAGATPVRYRHLIGGKWGPRLEPPGDARQPRPGHP